MTQDADVYKRGGGFLLGSTPPAADVFTPEDLTGAAAHRRDRGRFRQGAGGPLLEKIENREHEHSRRR